MAQATAATLHDFPEPYPGFGTYMIGPGDSEDARRNMQAFGTGSGFTIYIYICICVYICICANVCIYICKQLYIYIYPYVIYICKKNTVLACYVRITAKILKG
jgi:hypothetical protein